MKVKITSVAGSRVSLSTKNVNQCRRQPAPRTSHLRIRSEAEIIRERREMATCASSEANVAPLRLSLPRFCLVSRNVRFFRSSPPALYTNIPFESLKCRPDLKLIVMSANAMPKFFLNTSSAVPSSQSLAKLTLSKSSSPKSPNSTTPTHPSSPLCKPI